MAKVLVRPRETASALPEWWTSSARVSDWCPNDYTDHGGEYPGHDIALPILLQARRLHRDEVRRWAEDHEHTGPIPSGRPIWD
ncbi:hypothetical protein CYJ73_17330 [Gordonia terrae]|uniref:Uncharacterized protein n=1 Tax=Gordonia terrae TaxID=2055 RepID=A0A2I1R5F8_9ACTN|nr:hypothetical protein [Gordonia terrae]PKZ64360.1 hypothetical protein CYJ73_17330 [Gordonia terrae]UPW07827.1 hypothetical protein M1C59_17390 [Gordonia terrae]